jgi:hypothetical protein
MVVQERMTVRCGFNADRNAESVLAQDCVAETIVTRLRPAPSGHRLARARRMRRYDDAQMRQIFRDLIDMPADVAITKTEITVRFHRRAHLPIVLASGLIDKPVAVPWWNGRALRPLDDLVFEGGNRDGTSHVRASSASAPRLPDAGQGVTLPLVNRGTSQLPMHSFCA